MSSIQAKPDAWGARKIEATSCSQSAPENSEQQDQYCEHSDLKSRGSSSHRLRSRCPRQRVVRAVLGLQGRLGPSKPKEGRRNPLAGARYRLAVASSMQVHLNPRPSGVPDSRDSEPTVLAAPPLHDPAALRTLSMERLWLQNLLVVKQCLSVFLAVVALELKGSVPELLLHATEETAANLQTLHIEICREGCV